MKRYLLTGILAFAVSAALSGCGTAHIKPEGLSDNEIQAGPEGDRDDR